MSNAIAIPNFNILRFPLGGAQQELERVSRAFSGAFRKPFQKAFAAPDTVAAAAPTDPTTLGTLKLWYKPRSLGLADNDPISTNTDYSGNGWHATGVTTTRPLFKTNIVNGLAAALYDGTDDKMEVASGAYPITNNVASCTIVCVASTTTVSVGAKGMFSITTGPPTAARFQLRINSTAAKFDVNGRRLDADTAATVTGSASISTSTFYIFAMQVTWSAATVKGYINGGSADVSSTSFQTSGNTSATDSVAIRLGANAAGTGAFWNGYQGDQLVYVPALSLSDLNLLGAYLGTTYGLTWTTAT